MTVTGGKGSAPNQGEVPKGWGWTTLGTIADIRLGKMLSPKAYEHDLLQLPYLRNQNIRWGSIDFADVKRMGFRGEEIERFGLVPGDLLVCEGGAAGRCAVYLGPPCEFMYQKALHRVRPIVELSNSYFLQFCLQHYVASGTVIPRLSETTIQHLPLEKIRELKILLPPFAEQQRIVAEIEKQFSRLDAAMESLNRIRANLKRYRASVLKAACEGRLVPMEAELARAEGRDYEPADVLLQRILKERRAKWEAAELGKTEANGKAEKSDKWKAKYREPVATNTSDRDKLPEGWCWATIGQIALVQSGQTPKGVESAAAPEGEIPWFKVGDMNVRGNDVHMRIAKRRLTFAAANRLGFHIMPAGTVVFPKRGGAIATNKKRLLAQPSCCDLNTMGIKPGDTVGAYFWWWFSSVDLGQLSDGSNVPQINHGDIEPLALPLPPVPEQQRIVFEVERRLSVVEEIEAQVNANLKRAERLRQSILKRAFEGKLVPQDPNDEPASVLLERIRAERKATGERDASRKRGNSTKKKQP